MVRSSPNKLHTVFDFAAKKADLGATRPPCCCHEQRHRLEDIGEVREAEGHLAVVPVIVKGQDGRVLRPRDALPINGLKAREVTCKAIQAFAKQVKGAVPDLQSSLPAYLFPESGNGLKYVQNVVAHVSCMLYVPIVDKGPRVLWGFCKTWAWDVVHEFLHKEGYKAVQHTAAECHRLMSSIAVHQGWSVDSKAELCRLYLLGKAKSLLKGKWLWRPIAANPKPVLHKTQLTTTARALMTCLRMLIAEIPMSFQVLRVTDLAQWYRWIDSMGLTTLVELDCKEQSNRLRPEWVVQHVRGASAWLYDRKRWRSSKLTLSIHKDHKTLDRAGKACAQRFRYVTHEDLIRPVEFDLTPNNRCTAAGQVWERDGCILMAGPFSA